MTLRFAQTLAFSRDLMQALSPTSLSRPPGAQRSFTPAEALPCRTCDVLACRRALPLPHCYYDLMRRSWILSPPSVVPYGTSLCWLLPSQLETGPSRRYLRETVPACQNPYPGCSLGALGRFFPRDFGLPHQPIGSAPRLSPSNSFWRGANFGAAVFVNAFWPTGLLAAQAVPTLFPLCEIGRRGFYIQAERDSLPLHALDMLVTQIDQLVT